MTQLTYVRAARRVGRSERSIRLWRRQGMPMGWVTVEGQRTRVVEEEVLLSWFRDKLQASPVHQARMRRLAGEAGLPSSPGSEARSAA